jgi:hypothetical protein
LKNEVKLSSRTSLSILISRKINERNFLTRKNIFADLIKMAYSKHGTLGFHSHDNSAGGGALIDSWKDEFRF